MLLFVPPYCRCHNDSGFRFPPSWLRVTTSGAVKCGDVTFSVAGSLYQRNIRRWHVKKNILPEFVEITCTCAIRKAIKIAFVSPIVCIVFWMKQKEDPLSRVPSLLRFSANPSTVRGVFSVCFLLPDDNQLLISLFRFGNGAQIPKKSNNILEFFGGWFPIFLFCLQLFHLPTGS